MTKEEFDNTYGNYKVIIHCQTEEDAKDFLKLADSFGYKWLSGHNLLDFTYFHYYQEETCYELYVDEVIQCAPYSYYDQGYRVIQYKKEKDMNIKLTVDGKEIELSNETLDNLKKALEKPKVFKPEINEVYFRVSDYGEIHTLIWSGSRYDLGRFELGNYFKTEKEAEKYHNWLKFHADVRKWLEENPQNVDWDDTYTKKYSIYYNCQCKDIRANECFNTKDVYNFFKSHKQLEKFIIDIGEDRIKKYMFGVE